MRRLNRLVRDLRRRFVRQVLAAYAVACRVVHQLVPGLCEGLRFPDRVAPTGVALPRVGLPDLFATALVQEGGGRVDGAADARLVGRARAVGA